MLLSQRRHPAARRSPPGWPCIGPNADRVEALFGCYSFVNHVLPQHPGHRRRASTCPTVREALAGRAGPAPTIVVAPRLRGRRRRRHRHPGCRRGRRAAPRSPWSSSATSPGSSAAAPWGRAATATTSSCPACSASSSRPCSTRARRSSSCCSPAGRTPSAGPWSAAPPWCRRSSPARRAAPAVAGVLSGRVNPSGRLPVSLPRSAGAQPFTYLHPALGGDGDVTNLSTAPGPAVRARAVVHLVPRTTGLEVHAEPRRANRSWRGCGSPTPATGPAPTSCSSTAATSSARSPARWRSSLGFHRVHLEAGRVGARSPSRCRPPGWPSPTARVAGWSSPASCRCGPARPWTTGPPPRPSSSPASVTVVTQRDERWTPDAGDRSDLKPERAEPGRAGRDPKHEP